MGQLNSTCPAPTLYIHRTFCEFRTPTNRRRASFSLLARVPLCSGTSCI
jgi:hypothetical protein